MVTDFFIAFSISIILTISTVLIYEKSNRRGLYWFVFPTVFFGIWAGGLWIEPTGKEAEAMYWILFVIAGLLSAFSLAHLSTERPPQGRRETIDMLERINKKKNIEKATFVVLNLFFFLIVVILLLTVGVRYVFRG